MNPKNVGSFIDTTNQFIGFYGTTGGDLMNWTYYKCKNDQLEFHHKKTIETGCCIKEKNWTKTSLIEVKNKILDTLVKFEYY